MVDVPSPDEEEVDKAYLDEMPLMSEAIDFSATEMYEVTDYFVADATLDQIAPVFRQVVHARKVLGQIESMLAIAAAGLMPAKYVTAGGVNLERQGPSGSIRWDDDGLLAVLVARSRDERQILDEETGEYESEVDAFLRVLKDCASIGYFRMGKAEEKTGLKGHGIDPEEFLERPSGPRKAKVLE